jgi:hypothetical protein
LEEAAGQQARSAPLTPARAINAATDQLELRDQPVIALQKLIAFFGKSFIESFQLVDPAL